MQFTAQDRAYRRASRGGSPDLVLLDGEPIGRLWVDRSESPIHVIDIALLPEQRGRGIGTVLLEQLVGEARRAGKAGRLRVLRTNRALSLYRRLGFRVAREADVYAELEWHGVDAQAKTAS
ncbi:MAG: GNAT family N-acetyltransferase [Solirubrobacterales bacterium]|nr:GNAT family N-acetyltransferase [Solirubrobacterales bacterium]